jgi:glycosyltransferase involved in cell wall biosynthesis
VLLAIIPALNEEETVGDVVRSVREHLDADVLVIDDGSRDRTTERAAAAGAIVLRHPFNLGVGAALRTGFRYARSNGYDIAVQVDADGQHEVTEAKRLADAVDAGADLVVGSRFEAGFETSRLRRLSMRFLSRWVSRYLGVSITDTTSGFRGFGPVAIDGFADAYPRAYLSDTVEALLVAGDWGLRVEEIPVRMLPRQGGQPSAGTGKSIYHLLRLSLVIALHRVRRPLYVRGSDQ